jgi:hypothetical protein
MCKKSNCTQNRAEYNLEKFAFDTFWRETINLLEQSAITKKVITRWFHKLRKNLYKNSI